MSDAAKTREWLQGYGSAAADLAALGFPVQCVTLLEAAGLTYHDLMDAGLDTPDLGNIARARAAAPKEG